MKFFKKAPDGGETSGVTGYYFPEIKPLFSIVLLKFNTGTREAYHSHAFNAVTFWIKGKVIEHDVGGDRRSYKAGMFKYTPRDKFHRVEALTDTWAISIRGRWVAKWQELRRGGLVNLTHGRIES